MIELLVAIAIIAVLAAMLLPALSGAKYRAKLTTDINNHKQIALGVMLYTGDFDDRYPTVKKVGWRQGPWNPIRYQGSDATIDYRADLIDYFSGDGINRVWTCPLATHDWDGSGNFLKGGGENGGSLDDMNLKGTRISYNFYFGRTGGSDAWGSWDKPYGGGCEITPSKGMLKVGDAMEFDSSYRAYIYNGTGQTLKPAKFRILSSDVYLRYHHGFWRFAHQGFGSNRLVNRQRFSNTGYSEGTVNSEKIPGVSRYDYTYSRDDGSVNVLRNLTAYDQRAGRINDFLVPNPENE